MGRKSWINGKSILITGGTGSLGKALTKKLLVEYSPERVIVFSRDECKQWEMQQEDPLFQGEQIRYFIGDVRDKERLCRAFRDVQCVVHAAALKQVPTAEYNPAECVKTNVIGGMNVIDAALDCGVEKVVALSTDKAVSPANLYGATKLCSDKLFVGANVYAGRQGYPRFSVVRYGNVVGSRGSIIPFFRRLVEEGADSLPVTDERMTRFWITLEQAVAFVLGSLETMYGGEIFVPKIPSMSVMNLAKALAPTLPTRLCGIRPGEKLHEVMISAEDAPNSREFPAHYVIYPPESQLGCHRLPRKGEKLAAGFCYSSDSNGEWMSVEQLRVLLREQRTAGGSIA